MQKIKYSIAHSGFTVSNLEISVDFYRKNFGFEEVKRADKLNLGLKLALLNLNGSSLELLQPYSARKDKPAKAPLKTLLQKINSAHLAVSADNLRSAYDFLKENGVEFATEYNERFFFCIDPDGFLIEVKQK